VTTPETSIVAPASPVAFVVGSFWIRRYSTTADQVIYSVSPTKYVAIEDNTAGGRIYFYDGGVITNTNLTVTSTSATSNIIVQKVDAGTYRVYCDGAQSSADYTVSGFDSVATLSSCSGMTEDGPHVAYVVLFNDILTSGEIANLYSLGTPGTVKASLTDMRNIRLGVQVNGEETPANAEISVFNPIARYAEIYVNVPTLSNTIDTKIDIWYGGTGPKINEQPVVTLEVHSEYRPTPLAGYWYDRSGCRCTLTHTNGTGMYEGHTGQYYLDGNSFYSTGGWIEVVAPTAAEHPFNFGTGDFSIEWVMRPTSYSTARNIFSSDKNLGTYPGMLVYTQVTTGEVLLWMSSNGTTADICAGASFGNHTIDTWSHYAVVRSGGTVYLWKDGEIVNTVNIGASAVYCNTANNASLLGPSSLFYGYFDMFRIIKGRALWTAEEDYIAPTSKFSRQEGVDITGYPMARTVWDADYLSVHHLNYAKPGVANGVLDSGRYGCHGTLSSSIQATYDQTIAIDNGFNSGIRSVAADTLYRISPTDPSMIYPSPSTSQFDYSFETMVEAGTSNTAPYATIISNRETAERGCLQLSPSGYVIHAPSGTTNTLSTSSPITGWGSTPVKFSACFSDDIDGNRAIYIDGELAASAAHYLISTSNYGLYLFHDGSFGNNDRMLVGTLYEARVSRVVRPAEWMRLFDVFENDQINEVEVPVDVNEIEVDFSLMDVALDAVSGDVLNTAFQLMECDLALVQVQPIVMGLSFGLPEMALTTGSALECSFSLMDVALDVNSGRVATIACDFPLMDVAVLGGYVLETSFSQMEVALLAQPGTVATLSLSLPCPDIKIEAANGRIADIDSRACLMAVEMELISGASIALGADFFPLQTAMSVLHGQSVSIATTMIPAKVRITTGGGGDIDLACSFVLPEIALRGRNAGAESLLSYDWGEQWSR
jgi:hypothetical protein